MPLIWLPDPDPTPEKDLIALGLYAIKQIAKLKAHQSLWVTFSYDEEGLVVEITFFAGSDNATNRLYKFYELEINKGCIENSISAIKKNDFSAFVEAGKYPSRANRK